MQIERVGSYRCPACGHEEIIRKPPKGSDMVKMQYAPRSGWFLQCKCGTRTVLMEWGGKPHEAWYRA